MESIYVAPHYLGPCRSSMSYPTAEGSEADDAAAVARMQQLAQNTFRHVPSFASSGEPTPLPQAKLDLHSAIDDVRQEEKGSESYFIKLLRLVTLLQIQDSQTAQLRSRETRDLKREIRSGTENSARYTQKIGDNNLYFSVISLGCSVLAFRNEAIAQALSQRLVPSLGDTVTAGFQADKSKIDTNNQILLSDYSAKANKEQADSENKRKIMELLDRALADLKSATDAR